MRYTNIIWRLIAITGIFTLWSCDEKAGTGGNDPNELLFSPYIGEMTDIAGRGFGNLFFELNDEVEITIGTSRGESGSYTYVYDVLGVLRGSPGYVFPLDDTYITSLTAIWPADAGLVGSFIADQRDYQDHRRSDWLVATAELSGVMPTDVPVPLLFDHNNALLEFELVGQNTDGLSITELVLELEVDGKPTACWAYCGNENGRAALIVRSGTQIESREGYLIGTIPGESDERFTIILPELNITLEAGYKYLVTLTPRGYNLDAYIEIGGWTEDLETGIGVPFHNPSEGENGDYIIQTPVQLITMSYVNRHYTNGSTIQWPTLTYTLVNDFVMTAEYADLYIPIPVNDFSGSVIFQGQPITSITYDGGEVLELFTTEN